MSGRTSAPGRITPHDGRAGREADFAYETRRYAELKGVIDVLVSLPVLTGRQLAPRLLQPGCCGVVGSGPSATRDSRHTVTHVTKSIIAPMPAGWHRLLRFNPCSCLRTLWPVRGQSANNSVHHGHMRPQSSHAADSPSIVLVERERGLRLTRVRGLSLASEALRFHQAGPIEHRETLRFAACLARSARSRQGCHSCPRPLSSNYGSCCR